MNKKIENVFTGSGFSFHKKPAIISLDTVFKKREQAILERIKIHYSLKLSRYVGDEEAKEIANNLLCFAQAIYGT